MEYPWTAAWCFFAEGGTAAEDWVRDRALSVLEERGREVASGIYRQATTEGLATSKRKKTDEAARYLNAKAPHLDHADMLVMSTPARMSLVWAVTGLRLSA